MLLISNSNCWLVELCLIKIQIIIHGIIMSFDDRELKLENLPVYLLLTNL